MAYRFYLGGVLLPVTPGKLSVKIENKNKTVTLIDRGEINLLKSPGLSEISFDILLPSQAYPFANESVMPPRYYLSLLESADVKGEAADVVRDILDRKDYAAKRSICV